MKRLLFGVATRLSGKWQLFWSTSYTLYTINPYLGDWKSYNCDRKQKGSLSCLRIIYAHLTHSYLIPCLVHTHTHTHWATVTSKILSEFWSTLTVDHCGISSMSGFIDRGQSHKPSPIYNTPFTLIIRRSFHFCLIHIPLLQTLTDSIHFQCRYERKKGQTLNIMYPWVVSKHYMPNGYGHIIP